MGQALAGTAMRPYEEDVPAGEARRIQEMARLIQDGLGRGVRRVRDQSDG